MAAKDIETDEFAHLGRAFFDNFSACFTVHGLNGAGGLSTTNDVTLCAPPGCPFFLFNNCTRFNGDAVIARGGDVDAAIDQVLAKLASPAHFMWIQSRFSSPADLGDRLIQHGLSPFMYMPVLAKRLADTDGQTPQLPPGYTVGEVTTPEEYAEWVQVLLLGTGLPEPAVPVIGAFYTEAIGLRWAPAMRMFAVRYDGKIVATSQLWVHASVAGIYSVATLPAHRRKGLATAVTLAATLASRSTATSGVAVLQASPAGFPVYHDKLGWRVVDNYLGYVPKAFAEVAAAMMAPPT